MSIYMKRSSPSPYDDDECYPCPECKKQLKPDEFNNHLKTCNFIQGEESFTSRHVSKASIYCHEDIRVLCKSCGRKFLPERIAKHKVICENLVKKRPTFEITKRNSPIPEPPTIKSRKNIKFSKEFENRLWHKQHQDFINNMRFAREQIEEEEKGLSPLKLKPPLNLSEALIECPTCHRKFSQLPAERHIPKCRDIIHKPRPPPLYREPSTKLPSISNSKLRDFKSDINSLSPSVSKSYIDRSPNTTYSSIPVDRHIKGLKSFKDNKLMSRCPNCHKLVFKKYLKLHVSSCQYTSYELEGGVKEKENHKCINCDHVLIAKANYCMMCGTKTEEING